MCVCVCLWRERGKSREDEVRKGLKWILLSGQPTLQGVKHLAKLDSWFLLYVFLYYLNCFDLLFHKLK